MIFVAKQRRDEAAHRALRDELRRLIDRIGSQKAVAQRTGLHQSQLSGILTGRTSPRIEALIAIRAATGKSVDALLGLPSIPVEDAIARQVSEIVEARFAQEQRRLELALADTAPRQLPPPKAETADRSAHDRRRRGR